MSFLAHFFLGLLMLVFVIVLSYFVNRNMITKGDLMKVTLREKRLSESSDKFLILGLWLLWAATFIEMIYGLGLAMMATVGA